MDQTSRLQLARIVADVLDPDNADPVLALRQAINDHANKLDIAGIFIHGLAADRPPPGVPDRFYVATDTLTLTRDNGSAWENIQTTVAGPAGGVLSGTFPSPGFAVDMATQAELDAVAAALGLAVPPIGGLLAYAGTGDPPGGAWLLADGRLVDRTTYAAFFTGAGHAYNGGVDPGSNKVRLPDKRGRVIAGADNMGTTQGAAGRIPNSNRARGQNGGEERHTLAVGEVPSLRINAPNQGVQGDSGFNLPRFVSGAALGPALGNLTTEGGGGPHNIMQPYEVDNVIVRVL